MNLLMLIVLPAAGRPQGYELVYSPPRAYAGSDWMDVKAIYVKAEGDRVYFYVEYHGTMPNSPEYCREIDIYMDTDRNSQMGDRFDMLGRDYYIYFYLHGDDSKSYAELNKWNSTVKS